MVERTVGQTAEWWAHRWAASLAEQKVAYLVVLLAGTLAAWTAAKWADHSAATKVVQSAGRWAELKAAHSAASSVVCSAGQ